MTFSPRALEAAWQAYQDTPIDLLADSDEETKRCVVNALTAALAVDGVALQGWQPIESAPNNGKEHAWPYVTVLVVDENGDVTQADYKGEDGWWPANTDSEYGSRIYPTHWMPLPPPPAASDREERDSTPKEKP